MCPSKTAGDAVDLRVIESLTSWQSQSLRLRVSSESRKRIEIGRFGGDNEAPIARISLVGACYDLADVAAAFLSQTDVRSGIDFETASVSAYSTGELPSFLERLDGSFAAVLYDESSSQLLMFSDRLGSKPLYWFHHDGVFAWASSLRSLIVIPEVSKELDTEALACFLDLGFLLEDSTWFENVRLLNPASLFSYQCDSSQRRYAKYWDWNKVVPRPVSFEDSVSSLYSVFMDSVEERFDPQYRFGLSLSGGLDSRALLAAVTRLNPSYEGYAFVFGSAGSNDVLLAQQVCQLCNWELEHFPLSSESNWISDRRKLVLFRRNANSTEYADYDRWIIDPSTLLELGKILQRPLDLQKVQDSGDAILRAATAIMFLTEVDRLCDGDTSFVQACLGAIHESV